jgi:large subunit ribosomal protein L25
MKSITIKGSKRESVGKKDAKALRNAEKVPCVLYGGETAVHFSAKEIAFKSLVYTPNVYTAVIELESGETYNAIVQDIQFHPVTDRILHMDFYQIFDDKEITMNIPVALTGNAPGVIAGGALRFNKRRLKVRAIPANLPDELTADISALEIGSKLYVTELKNDKFTILEADNTVVVQVRMSRNASKDEELDGEEPATEEGGEEAAAE